MTEGDTSSLANKIATEQVPGQDNIRESVVTFSHANLGDVARPLSSSITRSIVVDAAEQLEAHRDTTSSSFLTQYVPSFFHTSSQY
jgi:hypothetical protein